MDLLLLPGNSKENEEDFEKLSSNLSSHFGKVVLQRYRHWGTGEKLLDFDYEYGLIEDNVSTFGDFGILGKSAGAILAIKAVSSRLIRPKRCVLVGTAIHFARKLGIEIEDLLRGYDVPTCFIQKTGDPAYFASDLDRLLSSVLKCEFELKAIPGDAHDYSDVENLSSMVSEYLLGGV